MAAAAAERLFPSYEAFSQEDWGEPQVLRRGLDAVWEAADADPDAGALAAVRQEIERVAPDNTGNVSWKSRWSSDALDAAIAVAQAADAAPDPTVENAAAPAQTELEVVLANAEPEDTATERALSLFAADLEVLLGGEPAETIRKSARTNSVVERVRDL